MSLRIEITMEVIEDENILEEQEECLFDQMFFGPETYN